MKHSISSASVNGRKKIQTVSLFVFLTMFMIGIEQELSGMNLGKIRPVSATVAHYQMMLFCAGLLLIYLIPFALFLNYTCRKMSVSRKLAVIGFFSGWFVPGWIAGDLNDAASSLIRHLTSKNFNNAWGDSIEAPIIEETLKVLVVIWVLFLFNRHQHRHCLIAGMAVGMGFQFGEDLSYIENQLTGSFHDFASAISFTITDRISGCLASHWCYTGLTAVAIYLIFRQKRKKAGLLLLLAVLVSHGLSDGAVGGVLYEGLLSALVLVPMFFIYMKTLESCDNIKEKTGIIKMPAKE